jgi:hypothetical protein
MLVPGHLAVAVVSGVFAARAAAHRVSVGGVLLPAALGGLTPDLMDKSRMAMGGSIYGRTIGHSLLFLGLVTALWAAMRWFGQRGEVRRGVVGFWVLGIASHLAADVADDAIQGWMAGTMVASSWFAWPWATPYDWAARATAPHWAGWPAPFTPLEVVVVVAALVWFGSRSRRRSTEPV